jgi:hypothetical protein
VAVRVNFGRNDVRGIAGVHEKEIARAYALIAAVLYDAFIASQDGKFTYW